MSAQQQTLVILGTRGIPARHGGFETFAEKLATHLVTNGWRVIVYCQEDGSGDTTFSTWKNVERVHIPARLPGLSGTILFDLLSIVHSRHYQGTVLTLGYNTAIFNLLIRLRGQVNVINMDGIEWRRQKWGMLAKSWLWLNDWLGCKIGHHLIADNPGIARHLQTRVSADKISMIPYGADATHDAAASELEAFGLSPGGYAIVVARPEPENSILELVRSFSSGTRGFKLVVLGDFTPAINPYHDEVMRAASDEVLFPGAIYETERVQSLRQFCLFYAHGHQVGGTNPSLVEALGAGNAVLAHDNPFNRWVAGGAALYFGSERALDELFTRIAANPSLLNDLRLCAGRRYAENFTWPRILGHYEALLTQQGSPAQA